MNVLVNALRHVMTRESYHRTVRTFDIAEVPLEAIILGLQMLTDEFCEQFKTVPDRIRNILKSETGCGTCEVCQAASKAAWGDGKAIHSAGKQANKAIEGLIATMLGKSN